MRIKVKDPIDKLWWHNKFIIFPRLISSQWVFLETVQARLRSGFYDEWWEYKLVERKETSEGKT